MIGYALNRAWVFLTFFNSSIVIAEQEGGTTATAIYQLSLLALVAISFICGLNSGPCERISHKKRGRIVPALICAVGTCCIPFSSPDTAAGAIITILAGVGTGVGSGTLLLMWGKVYSFEGGPAAAAEASLAYFIATLLVPFYRICAPTVQLIIIAFLPIVSTILLARELRQIDENEEHRGTARPVETEKGTPSEGPAHLYEGKDLKVYRQVLSRFAVSALVFGAVISIVRCVCTAEPYAYAGGIPSFAFPLAALMVAAVELLSLFFSEHLDLAFTYRPVLIFMAIGCIFLPFADEQNFLPYIFTLAGYFCFEIVTWVIMSDLSWRFDVSPFETYGLGRGAASAGILLGSISATIAFQHIELTTEVSFSIGSLMLFILIITYTLVFTERDISHTHRRSMDRFRSEEEIAALQEGKLPEGEEATEDEPKRPLSLEERVELVAEEYGISKRELEVFQLLAQGRTAARIEQELYISRGTVNTYSHRIYQKLDVHSRQELLDLVYAAGEEDKADEEASASRG